MESVSNLFSNSYVAKKVETGQNLGAVPEADSGLDVRFYISISSHTTFWNFPSQLHPSRIGYLS